jgi:hypothetical protein
MTGQETDLREEELPRIAAGGVKKCIKDTLFC